jgi:hypothetical protein
MNIKQYLSEEKLIDNVARIVPWFAPLIPASFAYHNSVRVLELAKIEAGLVAFVVELLGLATVHTFFSLAESLKTAKENKPKHETIIMGFMAAFYLAIVVTVNILLDLNHVWQIIAARALLSLISIPAAVTLSIRNLHKLRQNDDTRDHLIASLRGKLGSMTSQFNSLQEKANVWQSDYKQIQNENKRLQDETSRLQALANQLQTRADSLQTAVNEQQPVVKAWQSLNEEHQTLAKYNAKILTVEQTANILGVKDARTVQSRASKLNGVTK